MICVVKDFSGENTFYRFIFYLLLFKIYQIESTTKISSFGESLFKLNGNGRKLLTFQYFLLFIFLKCIDDKL